MSSRERGERAGELASDLAERASERASEIAAVTTERVRKFSESAIKTPANAVTFLRLLFSIPVLVWILDKGRPTWAIFTSWLLLWLTDGLDAWLARRDGTTRSGAFLDPLADKILVLGGFVALAINDQFAWVPVGLVAAREVFASGYRIFWGRHGYSIPSRRLGKWKTNVQFLAVALVLLPPTANNPEIHDVALWAAVAFSLVSLADLLLAEYRE